MQSTPKISVLTPSFNQCAYIEEALLSVKEQNYAAVEHIVVDGASTDSTVEILKRYAATPGWEHLSWVSEPDRGQSDALNKALAMAQGDIIGWLNSDERYRPGCLSTVVAAFHQHPDVDVLYGDYTWIGQDGSILQVRREIEFSRFVLFYHRVLYIHSAATFFRRRVFEDGNLFDTSLSNDMDYEFFLRLAHRGYRFRRIPSLLADFRWHRESKTSTQAGNILQQHDRTLERYSPILQKISGGFPKRAVLLGLRMLAAGRRYSEKLLRGHYFSQFAPSRFIKNQQQ